jgi:hypothetical protein
MFLKASIERILSDTGTRRKEHTELRKACDEAIGLFFLCRLTISLPLPNVFNNFNEERLNAELQASGQEQNDVETSAVLPNSNFVFLADHYFLPFELVVGKKNLKTVYLGIIFIGLPKQVE